MHRGAPLPKKSEKQGSTLQREYAWRGERCSGNNKAVKSLSPQAPCMAHLDLMAGALSLLLYLQYFLSEWASPLHLLSSPAIYNPALAICYFPLPLLPLCSFSPSLTFYLFLSSLSEGFYCLLLLPILFLYRFLDFLTLHLHSLPPDLLWEQQVSLYFFHFCSMALPFLSPHLRSPSFLSV